MAQSGKHQLPNERKLPQITQFTRATLPFDADLTRIWDGYLLQQRPIAHDHETKIPFYV